MTTAPSGDVLNGLYNAHPAGAHEPTGNAEHSGKQLTPFKAIFADTRSCCDCEEYVTPEWNGEQWVCPDCSYSFHPPTYIGYIRCKYCGDVFDEPPSHSSVCNDTPCSSKRRRVHDWQVAAVNNTDT